MIAKNKRLIAIVLTVALLLVIPFIAMQFTAQVNWSPFDFAIAGVLLLSAGFICELVTRKVKKFKYRVAAWAAVLVVLALVWAELAVGIFGSPFAES